MRVLFLTHAFPPASEHAAGSLVLALATALRGQGIDTQVVAPAAPGFPNDAELDGIVVDHFHYAPRRYEKLAYSDRMVDLARASWSARVTVLGFLGAEFSSAVRSRRRFEPDVIHAHWWFPSGLVGTWLSMMAHKPLVTTLHGSDVRLARTVAFSRPAFRHVLRRSTAVTAVSRRIASEAREVVSVSTPVVAPMPVPTDRFTPGSARRSDRLLFVGRLDEASGLDVLLHALSRMPQQSLGLDVVGDGDDRVTLEERAHALGLGERVRWHGAVPQARLIELYRAALAVVVLSRAEGLGVVAVEAQLCEAPVVAVGVGVSPDVVQHGRTGIVVDSVDADALAAALVSLVKLDDRGASLGAAGRLVALGAFAPESVARRYADIYQTAVARP